MYQYIGNDFDAFCNKVRQVSGSDDVSYIGIGLFGRFDKAISAALSLCEKFLTELPT